MISLVISKDRRYRNTISAIQYLNIAKFSLLVSLSLFIRKFVWSRLAKSCWNSYNYWIHDGSMQFATMQTDASRCIHWSPRFTIYHRGLSDGELMNPQVSCFVKNWILDPPTFSLDAPSESIQHCQCNDLQFSI